MASRLDAGLQIIGPVLGGLLSNPNVIASNSVNGWSIVNASDEQLVLVATHLAVLADSSMRKAHNGYNPSRWLPVDKYPVNDVRHNRILVSTNKGDVVTALYCNVSEREGVIRMGFHSPGRNEVVPVAWMELPQHSASATWARVGDDE